MIEGLSHVTLIVRDLDRTAQLLAAVLDARCVYESGDDTFSLARERFFDIGGVWLCLMEGEPHAGRTYDHIALKIDDTAFDAYRERLAASGVERRQERPRVEGEGRSLYFYDYDNHLFELHTGTLPERLSRYAAGR